MSERLLSVGLDVGTTTTQLVLSELLIENRASGFSVPEMEITQRKILYESPVFFTPIMEDDLVDSREIRRIVEQEYQKAGILRSQVDTGAIIITGETSRRENARRVLGELSDFAGDFVVATAGPELESVLAAKGAGAAAYSRDAGKLLLHLDIGGGTSNLALIREGKIIATGCLNVGGRLVKLDERGVIGYVSPAAAPLCGLKPGDAANLEQLENLAQTLVQALEMAAGLREPTQLLGQLWTRESSPSQPQGWHPDYPQDPLPTALKGEELVISFSGGVADCVEKEYPADAFGDIGPILGRAIRQSRLCQGQYMLGRETIRATVIGAGCHSAQLSGSTVFCRNVTLPMKNLPVIPISPEVQERELSAAIRDALEGQEEPAVLALPGYPSPSYRQVVELARKILEGTGREAVYLSVEQDMAKALGQALSLRMPEGAKILCLDRIRLTEESYLDVGEPVGPAFPVVVKTLVLAKQVKD